MQQQDIFRWAWRIARLSTYKKLLWFGFIPAFLTTVVSTTVYSFRGYQYWVELFQGQSMIDVGGEMISGVWGFFLSQPLLGAIFLLLLVLFLACYSLLPIFFHGGLVKLTESAIRGEPVRMRLGVIYSSEKFLPLFQASAITYPFKLSLVFVIYWAVRTFEPRFVPYILIPLGCWFVMNVILNTLLLFSEYYIVLHDKGIFGSFMESMRTVFMNLEEVMNMVFLMILIGLRILLNTAIAVGIPIGVMSLFSLFATSFLAPLAVTAAVGIGLVSLILLAYINAIFAVFLTAAWTLMFMKYTDALPDTLPEATPIKKAETVKEQTEPDLQTRLVLE